MSPKTLQIKPSYTPYSLSEEISYFRTRPLKVFFTLQLLHPNNMPILMLVHSKELLLLNPDIKVRLEDFITDFYHYHIRAEQCPTLQLINNLPFFLVASHQFWLNLNSYYPGTDPVLTVNPHSKSRTVIESLNMFNFYTSFLVHYSL